MRTLRHVIEMRTDPGSEEEIRLVFSKVADIAIERWPNLFADYEVDIIDNLPSYKTVNKKVQNMLQYWHVLVENGGSVPRSIKEIELTTTDIEHILCHVLETITVYEYPTPSVFSALTRLSIVSFLRGRGIHKDIELIAIDVFRQFSEFSNKHKNYMWFTDWSRKLVETVKEKKVEKE